MNMRRKILAFSFLILLWPLHSAYANPMCDAKFWKETSNAEIVKVLAEGHDLAKPCKEQSYTVGYRAVGSLKDPSLLALLIESGLSVTQLESNGRSILHAAVKNGHPSLIVLLINEGADPNLKDYSGTTPLNLACKITNNRAVIEALIALGADKNTKDNLGRTCFYRALDGNGRYDIIRYLVQQKFPTTYENCKSTSFSEKICEPAILAYLNGFHINYYGENRIELSTQVIDLLVSNGFDVNARSMQEPTWYSKGSSEEYSGSTPLRIAITAGNKDLIKALLKNGADINQRRLVEDELIGETPIFEAINPLGHARPDHSIISLLVFNGADLGSVTHNSTPVTEAIRQDLDTLKLLIDLGADIELRDKAGNTPLLCQFQW